MNTMKRILALVLVLMIALSTGVITASAEQQAAPSGTVINIPLVISATNLEYPTTVTKGSTANVLGTITCSYGKITKVTATISKGSRTYQSVSWSPMAKSMKLANTINPKLKFGKLAIGTYTLKIVVTAKYGTLKTATKTILNKRFKVVERAPEITVTGATYPEGTLYAGEIFTLNGKIATSCGKLSYIYAAVLDDDGHVMLRTDYTISKTSFDLRYTVNGKIPFEILPAGNYHYKLYAKAVYNGKTYTKQLIYSNFSIVED